MLPWVGDAVASEPEVHPACKEEVAAPGHKIQEEEPSSKEPDAQEEQPDYKEEADDPAQQQGYQEPAVIQEPPAQVKEPAAAVEETDSVTDLEQAAFGRVPRTVAEANAKIAMLQQKWQALHELWQARNRATRLTSDHNEYTAAVSGRDRVADKKAAVGTLLNATFDLLEKLECREQSRTLVLPPGVRLL